MPTAEADHPVHNSWVAIAAIPMSLKKSRKDREGESKAHDASGHQQLSEQPIPSVPNHHG